MPSFLRLFSRGNQTYEASVDTGNVTSNPPVVPNLSAVDQLQLIDPGSGNVQLQFSVIAGSMNGSQPWQQMDFKTRCFLTPKDTDKTAAVHIELNLNNGEIQIKDLTIFGQSAGPGSPQVPVSLPVSGLFTFVPTLGSLGALAFVTPEVLAKIGIGIAEPGTPGPTLLSCSPSATGTTFSIWLPIDSDNQSLIPYRIDIDTKKYAAGLGQAGQFGQTPALLFAQSESTTPSAEPFWILEVDALPAGIVLDTWNTEIVQPYLAGLNTVRSGLPASFIPSITTANPADLQNHLVSASFTLLDRTNQQAQPATLVLRDPASAPSGGALNIFGRTVGLVGPLNCVATFPNLQRADGSPLQAACVLTAPPADQTASFCENTAGIYFSFQHQFAPFPPPASQPIVRMGALDLSLPAATGTDTIPSETGSVHGSFRTKRISGDDLPDLVRLDYLSIKLAVTTLGVGGQDDVPGSEYAPPNQPYPRCGSVNYLRAPALQIPMADFPLSGAYYYLDVTETCYEAVSQTLTLRIEQQQLSSPPGGNGSLDVVIVDTEPFFIARLNVPDYQESLRTATTDQIASWDNSAADASWQISAGTQAFQLTLPPQGVTEAMHKQIGSGDITPGRPADFRFTPPATFNLLASPLPQQFVEVPWNLRRILGYATETAPGAVLNSATFELLYGLSATLAAKPGLMLAEIGARLGQLPADPPPLIPWQHSNVQESGYDAYTAYWAELLPQLRTRLAVLEPWSAAQPSGLTLTEADNLTFNLRSAADLAYPVPAVGAPSHIPANIPQGSLKGSFSWAFDSDRIYQGLWADPASVSCELSGLEFSPLGAWGEFTARFAQGKTSIIASVRMGRIQKLTIEQIGRIGNFWNRAKLVITYERTVAATKQFQAEQYPFTGNPILRKTAEYVQILEKRRDAAPTDTTGAYSACEFPEGDPPKIPVDSNWGDNVGDTGYRIPLWRPGAQPAEVYTKPLVRLHFKSAVSDGTSPADIYDPEKLYFYTDTKSSLSSNTDTWPKQREVDFGYVNTAATQSSNPTPPASADVNDFNAAEEPWIQPLLGPFTYNLKTASLTANITAGLPETTAGVPVTPIGAALRTITIMRGLDASAFLQPADAVYTAGLQIPDHVSNILRPIISVIPPNATPAELVSQWDKWKAQALDRLGTFTSAVNGFQGSVPATATRLCAALTAQIQTQFNFLDAQIENEIAGVLAGVYESLVPATAPPDFTAFRAQWAVLYASVQSELRYTGSEIRSLAATLQTQVDQQLVSVARALTSLSTALGTATNPQQAIQFVQTAAANIDGILGGADGLIAGILNPVTGGKLDQLRQIISTLRNTAATTAQTAVAALSGGTAIATVQGQINTFANTITGPAGVQATVDGLITNLSTAANGLVATTVETTLASINTKLLAATDWDSFKTAAAAELGTISTGLQATVQLHLAELGQRLDAYAALACQQILQTDLAAVLKGVQQLLGASAVGQFFDNLKQSLSSGQQAADAVEAYLHGLEASTSGFINAVLPELPVPTLPQPVSDAAMFLLRGFGDVPAVPQLNFGNVLYTAFRFAGLNASNLPIQLPQVNLSPLVGWANNVGDTVNAIAIGLPTCNLADSLLPFDLSSFDVGSFLPNIAGLDLTNLIPGLRLPQFPFPPNQYVTVTHGEDPQSRSAWVQIAMNFEIDDVELFSYFGVTLSLDTAVFQANTSLSAQAGQPVTRAMSGSITGDWSLSVGGFDVVIFEQCTLTFDQSGHFGFNITPAKVKLQGILDFLADIISDFFSGDGFTTSVTAAGVQTLLDLPLPDIQSGTFGIANLRLMASFGITFAPFQLQLGLGLASLEQPFTLTVFILGGAGYLKLTASYQPAKNIISATFNIGIFASASLAVSLGPISGGIYAYFGITVAYAASTGSAPDLQIALVLMFSGQVTLLGFLSVSLMLSLSGTYDSGSHTLTGTGTVSYSIQIGPFFSINVSAGVSYTYSNDPPQATLNSPPPGPDVYDAAAAEYLAMFYN